MARCYYCNKEMAQSSAKRCSRCRLVTYCSKECQAISWKASHKKNCRPHPAVLALPDGQDKPPRGTEARYNLDVDMALSAWMAKWRSVFQRFTTLALDLENHPPERVATHCLYIMVEGCDPELDKCKKYRLVDAKIISVAELDTMFPEFGQFVDDPTDFLRPRFVVLLQDAETGDPISLRRVQWTDLSIPRIREESDPKRGELFLARDERGEYTWVEMLRVAIDSMEPKDLPGFH